MACEVDERYQTPIEVVQALTPFADVTAAIAPTVTAPVAPELNDFLNQLAVAAARDEEVDTGTQELDKTQVSGGVSPLMRTRQRRHSIPQQINRLTPTIRRRFPARDGNCRTRLQHVSARIASGC